MLMTIKGRLYTVFLIILILTLVIAALVHIEKNHLKASLDNASRTARLIQTLSDINAALNRMELNAQEYEHSRLETYQQHLHHQHTLLNRQLELATQLAQPTTAPLQRLKHEIAIHTRHYYHAVLFPDEATSSAQPSSAQPPAAVFFAERLASLQSLTARLTALESDVSKTLSLRIHHADQTLNQTQWGILSTIFLILIVLMTMARPLINRISRSLQHTINIATAISQGQLGSETFDSKTFDSKILDSKTLNSEPLNSGQPSPNQSQSERDEINQVMLSLDHMKAKLRQLMLNLQGDAEQLARTSEQVAQSAEAISEAAISQSAIQDRIATAVQELHTNIGSVASSTQETVDNAKYVEENSQVGQALIQNTLTYIKKITTESHDTAIQFNALNTYSTDLLSIVEHIHHIAEQSRLFALNTTIESARAGEQGRELAMDADEAQRFAQDSGSAAHRTLHLMNEVQAGIESAIQAIQNTTRVAALGHQQATQANQIVQSIHQDAIAATHAVNQIANLLTHEVSVSDSLSQHIQHLADMSHDTVNAAHQARTAAHTLSHIASSLHKELAHFSAQ